MSTTTSAGPRYLVPCPCGRTIPTDVSQAGLPLKCECGATVVAPTLRGLKELPRVEQASAAAGGFVWRPGYGIALIGVLVVLAGVAWGIHAARNMPEHPQEVLELRLADSSDHTPRQWHQLYLLYKEVGFDREVHPIMGEYERITRIGRFTIGTAAVLVVIGLAMVGGGLFWKMEDEQPVERRD